MRFGVLIMTILAAVPCSASAADFYEERGGWTISAAERACGMTMEYEGPGETEVLFIQNTDGQHAISIGNANWSSEKGRTYDMTVSLNGNAYSGVGKGTVLSSKAGIFMQVEPDFTADFAAGSTLYLYLGETRMDQLSLAGTSAALAAMRRCMGKLRAELAAIAREEARWSHLAEDPFASGEGQMPGDVKMNNGSVVAARIGYPSRALRAEESGTVHYAVTVDAVGKALKCKIELSSGSASLDENTCTVIMRTAKFSPAVGENGKGIASVFRNKVNYTLPAQAVQE